MGDHGSDRLSKGRVVNGKYTRGARPDPACQKNIKAIYLELFLLWFGTLLAIRLVVFLQKSLALPDWTMGIVPLLFVYVPVWLCDWRKTDSWSYRLSIPAFRDLGSWWSATRFNLWLNVLTWPWYIPLYHVWTSSFWGRGFVGLWPEKILLVIAYHFFFVAIPEEIFYRGYFQTRLNEIHPRKFLIFGTPIGWGAVVASLFFAFGHSLVNFQWWHFATFFPGMIFAWMRERSDGILAGSMYHAACNVGITCLDTLYGIRVPSLQ